MGKRLQESDHESAVMSESLNMKLEATQLLLSLASILAGSASCV